MLERRIQSLLTRAAGGIYDKMFLDFFFPLFVIYLEKKKKKINNNNNSNNNNHHLVLPGELI